MKSETICRASVLREKRKMGNGRRNYKLRGISVQFSSSVMSNSSWSHAPQHARPRCPSPTPRVYPNPCRSSQWCHPTISSFAVPFSSCPQSVPAPGSFPMSQLFASGVRNLYQYKWCSYDNRPYDPRRGIILFNIGTASRYRLAAHF